ncbi:MAG: RagB/SusD family nutrient uptake outer membrane protein [Bacteroidaceae bacterium]|nr:RagB/SusD family nutrient uptake outer membrane protein [Bacteroidaceae bacterium]
MKKIISYTIIAASLLWACQPLDQEPSTSLSAETAIQTVDDLSYAVNGAYYLATAGSQMTLASELAIYADELGPDSRVVNGSGQFAQKIHERSVTPVDSWNAYGYLYRAIANINKALLKAQDIEDQEGAAPYIAELIGMRGLFHFHLATFFAPIPTSGSSNTMGIVLSTEVYPLDYKGARASLDQTYQQIIDDLTTYINSGYNKDPYNGLLNYWAALAIRARAYLYWGKNAEALADAKNVIENSPYKLYTIDNYTKVWETDSGDEIILQYAQDDDYNAQRYAPGYYTHPDGYTEYLVTDEFVEFMQSNPDDIRSQMVAYRTTETGKGQDGWFPMKYPGKKGSNVPLYSHSIKVVRLSEMYLIAAEAALKTTGAAAAVPYLNTLRQNRIENYVDATTTDIDDILNERRKELFAEGQIAFDFWRNGKDVVSGPATYKPGDNYNVLPIPKEEIDYCGGVLIQNPGY